MAKEGKYSAVWNILKRDHKVVLAIPFALQKRTIKGIINAKDNDAVFKLECAEKLVKFRLSYKKESARVTLTLRRFDDLNQLGTGDI